MPLSPPEHGLSIRGLGKVYAADGKRPAKRALDGIDLTVPRGSFFGLLGPNGAGKSTLINILAGLVNKTEGQVEIFGIDIDQRPRLARRAIGVVPQELNLDAFFSPREALDLQAGLYGVPRRDRITDELLDAVGLADKADAYARTLSGGMRRRLLVAKALVHRPPVVVLDEPTAGVDVELRRSLWRYMRELNEQGVTIVLTTHYLEEAQELCDRIAIVDGGRVVAFDTTSALLGRLDEKCLIVRGAQPFTRVPPALDDGHALIDGEGRLVLRYRRSSTMVEHLLDRLRAAGVSIADLTTQEADLEDLFVRLTGHHAEPVEEVA
ncbi:MAG TPA: ABC transporter ATP-binding protein [Geminicoccus sp.]|jgi:ABC-2 type transport system ATP-binding protein|uniref:ABC transporter ATP-binding protein n=1 Tax=Geminicoccus sp. TaxID=2024832 RepID=UPI002E322483|nr:ABC transporter ATP-binding protein [Geminicoccus sp.]HEX2526335.1 ABC transporter ATP-binding protein [Geminicoccus sp.]